MVVKAISVTPYSTTCGLLSPLTIYWWSFLRLMMRDKFEGINERHALIMCHPQKEIKVKRPYSLPSKLCKTNPKLYCFLHMNYMHYNNVSPKRDCGHRYVWLNHIKILVLTHAKALSLLCPLLSASLISQDKKEKSIKMFWLITDVGITLNHKNKINRKCRHYAE